MPDVKTVCFSILKTGTFDGLTQKNLQLSVERSEAGDKSWALMEFCSWVTDKIKYTKWKHHLQVGNSTIKNQWNAQFWDNCFCMLCALRPSCLGQNNLQCLNKSYFTKWKVSHWLKGAFVHIPKTGTFIFFTKCILEQRSCWTSSLCSNLSLQKNALHLLNRAMRGWGLILKGFIIQISMYWQQYTSFHILLESKYFSSIHFTQIHYSDLLGILLSPSLQTSPEKKHNCICGFCW